MIMPESAQQPNGNIEIHPDEGRELFFIPGTQWRVSSGYIFEFTRQGNLEIRNSSGKLLWDSATRNSGANRLSLIDGDLRVLSASKSMPLWSSKTLGHPGAFIAFQTDGNLVIYTPDRQPVWASDTNGK